MILNLKELYSNLSNSCFYSKVDLKIKNFTFHFSPIAGWGLSHSSVIFVDWESVALRLLGAFGTSYE